MARGSAETNVDDAASLALPAGVEAHPWNGGFSWRLPEPFPASRLSALEREQFDRDGFVVLEDVLGPTEIAEAQAEIDRYEAETDAMLRNMPGNRFSILESGAITFSIHLVMRSERLRAVAAHPTFAALCRDLVGPDVNLYWDQAVYKKPEKPRRFPWHQDNGYTYVEPQQYLTCWLALTDATLENGCPWVAPGLHRHGTLRHRFVDPLGWECFAAPPRAVAAPVRAGGVVVFSSLTPHLTGPNTTASVRKAYILQYAPVGAVAFEGKPDEGPPLGRKACDAPARQFAILRDGAAIAPPPIDVPAQR